MRKLYLFLIAAICLLSGCNTSQTNSNEQNIITIFHAGSLSVPFKEMAQEYKKLNPDVEIWMEAAGSVACARKITDLNRQCDIMASADYSVIDEMLIPEHAAWNIKFASNEMTIVYHEQSKYSEGINADNWHEILLRDDVIYGRSDPNADPCGYRAVLVSQLAEVFYMQEGMADKIMAKDNEYIRPKETDLLALLETNTIDYIFLYRSVAQQHNLSFVLLPDSINLKNPELKDYYKVAEVEINGKKPGEKIVKRGQPMVYGITIPSKAPNHKLAEEFLHYVLSEDKGMAIMEKNGQPSLIPAISNTYTHIPDALMEFARAK